MSARRTSRMLIRMVIAAMVAGLPSGSAWAGPKTPGNRTAPEVRKPARDRSSRKPAPDRTGRTPTGATKKQASGKAANPRPDPLAGAWPDARRPMLGNGRTDSEIVVAALRLKGMRQGWDEDRFLRHLAYVMDWARKSDLPEDAWSRTLLQRATVRHTIRSDRAARPGDLALFSLEGSSRRPSRVLVAVVVSTTGETLQMVGPLGGGIQEFRMGTRGKSSGDTVLRPCPAPRTAADGDRGKAPKKQGARKGAKPSSVAPEPCRAGELYLGRIPWEALRKTLSTR